MSLNATIFHVKNALSINRWIQRSAVNHVNVR